MRIEDIKRRINNKNTYKNFCTFIFGSIFLFIGNNLGKKINNKLVEKYSEIISSIILILIGIMELFI